MKPYDRYTNNHIKLLTYNVFMRPPGINEKGKDDYKDTRQRIISEQVIPEYDFLCFQELFTRFNTRRTKILKAARKSGLAHKSLSPQPPVFSIHKVNSGLLNFGRFEISRSIFKPFKYCSGVDAVAYKGVLYSKVVFKGEVLHIFNTHLQASYGPVTKKNKKGVLVMKKHYRSRLCQILELRQMITDILAKEPNFCQTKSEMEKNPFKGTILVTGDFNSKSNRKLPKDFFSDLPDRRAKSWVERQPGEKFNEYEFLYFVLSNFGEDEIVDFMKESYNGEHPGTGTGFLGDGNRDPVPEEDLDQYVLQSGCAIDFWFEIKPFKLAGGKFKPKIDKGKSCVVRPFLVKHEKFDKLSDHHGVELNLELVVEHKNKLIKVANIE